MNSPNRQQSHRRPSLPRLPGQEYGDKAIDEVESNTLRKPRPRRISTSLAFELQDGCPHPRETSFHLRLISWHKKLILSYCGLSCRRLKNRRIIAITHVWGNAEDHEIPGIPWAVPISKYKSLRRAFEGADKEDLHWLDILSIDQSNPEELFASTKLMSKVFGRTDAVNLWLPRSSTRNAWPSLATVEPSRDLFEEMVRAEMNDRRNGLGSVDSLRSDDSRGSPSAPHHLPDGTALTCELAMKMMENALTDPWFERVWTTQEMALASQLTYQHMPFDLENLRGWLEIFNSPLSDLSEEAAEYFASTYEDGYREAGIDIHRPAGDTHTAFMILLQSINLRSSSVRGTQNTLLTAFMSLCHRECKYLRDKVLTLEPILQCRLEIPEFDLSDFSPELADELWHHVVLQRVRDGDLSILRAVAPGPAFERQVGLWHPSIRPGGILGVCKSCESSSDAVNDYPYEIVMPSTPSEPAILESVRIVTCPAIYRSTEDGEPMETSRTLKSFCSLFKEAEIDTKASRFMMRGFTSSGEVDLKCLTGGMFDGFLKLGNIACPFWLPDWFFDGEKDDGEDPFRVRVVVPDASKACGKLRLWILGTVKPGRNVAGGRFPGVIGAVWVDVDVLDFECFSTLPVVDVEIP
ncbi:hypothetical protein HDU96_006244 [Phlyctochytrium bullatum]|nr:hypothetical protein HDU96_006244 [Phlyctochytrium bullatum]